MLLRESGCNWYKCYLGMWLGVVKRDRASEQSDDGEICHQGQTVISFWDNHTLYHLSMKWFG